MGRTPHSFTSYRRFSGLVSLGPPLPLPMPWSLQWELRSSVLFSHYHGTHAALAEFPPGEYPLLQRLQRSNCNLKHLNWWSLYSADSPMDS